MSNNSVEQRIQAAYTILLLYKSSNRGDISSPDQEAESKLYKAACTVLQQYLYGEIFDEEPTDEQKLKEKEIAIKAYRNVYGLTPPQSL